MEKKPLVQLPGGIKLGRLGVIGAAGFSLCGVCLCLGLVVNALPSSPAGATNTPRQVQATATEAQPLITATFVEIVLDTSTPAPTNTPTERPASSTPRPTATTAPPTDTQPPAATATSAPPTAAPLPTQAPTEPPPPTQAPLPTQPLPTQAPAASIALVSLTSPIQPGADARLVIQTEPGASCFLAYTAPSGTRSEAQGLGATTADGSGFCGWTWRIGTRTAPGTGRLSVSAAGANASFDIIIQ